MERAPDGAAMSPTAALRGQIRALMRRDGLSMRALAARVGVNHATLSRFLAGRTSPSPRLLAALAPHLGVGLGELFALGRADVRAEGSGAAPVWALPPGAGPEDFRATLERLAAMAGGSEVEGLLRAGFGPKRALLAQSGMAGPALARLDGLYELYVGRTGPALPPPLRRRVAGALLYFVLSVDGIPDDLFPVGYLDDAWVAELVWGEVEAFRHANAQGCERGGEGGP